MAENARDDGSHCFPSVDLIAWKAGYKPRNVVDIIRDLRDMQVLEVVNDATARRPTEYTIHLQNAPQKETFEEWQKANGRRARRVKPSLPGDSPGVQSRVPRERENAPLDEPRDANSRDLGVQSHVSGVQSHDENPPNARENAPEPVIEPDKEPVNRTSQLPRNGAAQTLVAILYDDILGIGKPTNYGKVVGQAEQLVKQGCSPEELTRIAAWLLSDDFWVRRGVTMSSIASQRDSFRSAQTAPRSNGALTVHAGGKSNGTLTDAERRREELRQWAYGDDAVDPTEDVIDVKGMTR